MRDSQPSATITIHLSHAYDNREVIGTTALNQDRVLANHQCLDKEYMCYVYRMFEMFLGQNNKFEACLNYVREFSKLKTWLFASYGKLASITTSLYELKCVTICFTKALTSLSLDLD